MFRYITQPNVEEGTDQNRVSRAEQALAYAG